MRRREKKNKSTALDAIADGPTLQTLLLRLGILLGIVWWLDGGERRQSAGATVASRVVVFIIHGGTSRAGQVVVAERQLLACGHAGTAEAVVGDEGVAVASRDGVGGAGHVAGLAADGNGVLLDSLDAHLGVDEVE